MRSIVWGLAAKSQLSCMLDDIYELWVPGV